MMKVISQLRFLAHILCVNGFLKELRELKWSTLNNHPFREFRNRFRKEKVDSNQGQELPLDVLSLESLLLY